MTQLPGDYTLNDPTILLRAAAHVTIRRTIGWPRCRPIPTASAPTVKIADRFSIDLSYKRARCSERTRSPRGRCFRKPMCHSRSEVGYGFEHSGVFERINATVAEAPVASGRVFLPPWAHFARSRFIRRIPEWRANNSKPQSFAGWRSLKPATRVFCPKASSA